MARPTHAQWLAARELAEVQPATRVRIAASMGVDVTSVYARASAEGWKSPDYRRADVQEALAELRGFAGDPSAGSGSMNPDEAEEIFSVPSTGSPSAGAGQDPSTGSGQVASAAAPGGPAADESDVAFMVRVTAFIASQLERIMAAAERRGGRIDKRQIDAIAALARMMQGWNALAKERAKEEEQRTDERLAEALRLINDKIIELARGEAARLVEAGWRPG